MGSNYCIRCGNNLVPQARFCPRCGAPVSGGFTGAVGAPRPGVVGAGPTGTVLAMAQGGFMTFAHKALPQAAPVMQQVGPLQALGTGFINAFRGIGRACTDVRLLIPALLLTVNWVTLTVLSYFGVQYKWVEVWQWLSSGSTGVQGGALGIIGSGFGKGVFAMFFMSLLVPLFHGQNPFSQYIAGAKAGFTAGGISLKQIALLGLGAGLAITLFQFMTYQGSAAGGMTAIAGFFVALRSLSQRSGFLWQMVGSLVSKRGGPVDQGSITRFKLGLALGFMLAGGLMFIPFFYICYLVGGVLCLLSLVLLIVAVLIGEPRQARAGA